jgi:hypothetical protein
MQKVTNPIPIFIDARGALLDGGQIFIGVANGDPEVNPITVYWDSALTIVAAQPIRTVGGRIVNGASPAAIFIAEDDYSMRIRDNDGSLVDYAPRYFYDGIAYQPLDDDLTAIAAGDPTTPFGRDLLTLSDQTGLVSAVGPLPYLPSSGGTLGGALNITTGGIGISSGSVAIANGALNLGTAGSAYLTLDTNGNMLLNASDQFYIRLNSVTQTIEFVVGGVLRFHIDATGSHTP